MSTRSLAAAALLSAGVVGLVDGAAALHEGFDSRPFVVGSVCFVAAARHGDARGRSDLLDDVVAVDDAVHAVVEVVLDAAADLVLAEVHGPWPTDIADVVLMASGMTAAGQGVVGLLDSVDM